MFMSAIFLIKNILVMQEIFNNSHISHIVSHAGRGLCF